MAEMNDQVIPDIAFSFGDSMQVASGRIGSLVVPTVDADKYRRVLRSFRQSLFSDGTRPSATVDFIPPPQQSWVFWMCLFKNELAATMRVSADLVGAGMPLFIDVLSVPVPAATNVYIVGKYDRQEIGLAAADNAEFPESVLVPSEARLRFKVVTEGGGLIPAGSMFLETSYWVDPSLRSWALGAPAAVSLPIT